MIDIKKELSENNIIMVIIPNDVYNKYSKLIIKQLKELNEPVCYLNSNMIIDELRGFLKKDINTENFFIVDTVTKTVNLSPKDYNNVVYITDPSALTEMNIKIKRVFDNNKINLLFFDSVSSLLVYRNESYVVRSIKDVIMHIRKNKGRGIFMALEEDIKKGKLKDVESLVDKVVRVGKNLS